MNINVNLLFKRPRLDHKRDPAVHSLDIFIPISDEIRIDLLNALIDSTGNKNVIF